MNHVEGAYTALVTPFDHEGEIDFAGLELLVEKQIEGKINGLVPCGTTGEASTMTEAEQLAVISRVADIVNGRVPIIAGTGTNDTKKTIEYTQKVSEIKGVGAALVVVPYYNKPDQRGIIHHFETVARYGKLPVVLYNIPGRSVVSMTVDSVAHLAKDPNIIAIKDATGDMVYATRLKELCPSFSLLSGDDFTTFPFMALGGHGCISVVSNLLPHVISIMVASTGNKDFAAGQLAHLRIQKLARALFAEPNPAPTKAAANLLGWFGETVRGPLLTCSESTLTAVEEALQDVNLLEKDEPDDESYF